MSATLTNDATAAPKPATPTTTTTTTTSDSADATPAATSSSSSSFVSIAVGGSGSGSGGADKSPAAGGDDGQGHGHSHGHEPHGYDGYGRHGDDEPNHSFCTELGEMLTLALPVSLSCVLMILPFTVVLIFLGHVGSSVLLDGASLATVFVNVIVLGSIIGLNSALDTLCSQAVGAGNKHLASVYMQSGLIVLLIALIPVAALLLSARPLLTLLLEPSDAALLAGDYLRIVLVAVPLLMVFDVLRRRLQAQSNVVPAAVITSTSLVLMLLPCYYLVSRAADPAAAIVGAAWALVAFAALQCLGLIGYIGLLLPEQDVWYGWQLREAWHRMGEYVPLSLGGFITMIADILAYDVLAIIAGRLATGASVALATHVVVANFAAITLSVLLGGGFAVSVRIGNALGGGHARHAQHVKYVGAWLIGSMATLFVLMLIFIPRQIAQMYTNDEAVISLFMAVRWVQVPLHYLDATNYWTIGVFGGCGRQQWSAISNSLWYMVVGLPLAYVFGFSCGLGLTGLWLGMGCASVGIVTTGFILLASIDWHDEVKRAQRQEEDPAEAAAAAAPSAADADAAGAGGGGGGAAASATETQPLLIGAGAVDPNPTATTIVEVAH